MFFWADVLCVLTWLYDMSLLRRTYLDESSKKDGIEIRAGWESVQILDATL